MRITNPTRNIKILKLYTACKRKEQIKIYLFSIGEYQHLRQLKT